jgi:hypothetical protein
MLTKTIRSRFNHEVGEKVEGCTIIERQVIIPPVPSERRLGVYSYLVEVPPAPANPPATRAARASRAGSKSEPEDFTRATPDQRPGGSIRRLPSR